MSEPYRDGIEYVVCEECGSHIYVERAWLDDVFEFDEPGDVHCFQQQTVPMECDWDPCGKEFDAVLKNPKRAGEP